MDNNKPDDYLRMKVIAPGITDKERILNIGDSVRYRGHLPGGNVKIMFDDGTEDIAHPFCFEGLR